jgi:hypothetical protein
MFISTREMLGQIAPSRALAEAVIEKCYGSNCDWSKISGDLAISSTLQKLGLDAFSDGALQHIVSALSHQHPQKTELTGDQA